MATKPRSRELCWKLIERLEKDYHDLSEAYHRLANEAQIALNDKDKELLEKCRKCKRGFR